MPGSVRGEILEGRWTANRHEDLPTLRMYPCTTLALDQTEIQGLSLRSTMLGTLATYDPCCTRSSVLGVPGAVDYGP